MVANHNRPESDERWHIPFTAGRIIRRARREDFKEIEAWHDEHATRIGSHDLIYATHCWLVVERKGTLLAALCFQELMYPERYRFISDLYARPGLSGGLAAKALGDWFEAWTEAEGTELRCETPASNLAFANLLLGRGYELVSLGFRRRPKETSE